MFGITGSHCSYKLMPFKQRPMPNILTLNLWVDNTYISVAFSAARGFGCALHFCRDITGYKPSALAACALFTLTARSNPRVKKNHFKH